MLGSAVEAEDIVQDVWLRWQATDRSVVLNAPAFLATTTQLAINLAQCARSRRETYVGPWLPEPVDTSADPTVALTRIGYWVIGYALPAVGWGVTGLFPAGLIATSTLAGLLEIVVASVIGAWLYKE